MNNIMQPQTKPEKPPVSGDPVAGSEGNICGVLVHVRPEKLEQVLAELANLPGTDVHQSAADGRVVVTVEDVPGQWAGNTLTDINNIKGVLSAALVFHHRDGEDESGDDEEVTQ